MTKYFLLSILSLLIISIASQSAIAAVEISSVTTKVRKEKGEKLVDVYFDISNNEPSGSEISIVFSLDNGKSFKIQPIAKELEGDIGTVKGNGIKKITWHPEKTCHDSSGTYDCLAEIRIPTGKPSSVLLDIQEFASTEWKFANSTSGKVQLNSLIKTGTFKPSGACANERGNRSQSVDTGAVFYTGATVGFPWYNSNPNYKGPMTGPGCSNFFAVKAEGTKDELIWINFSNSMRRKHPTLDITTDWDCQIRYFLKKSNGEEIIKIGSVSNNETWSEIGSITKYKLEIFYDSATVSEKSDPFKLRLLKKEFVYKGKDGVEYLKFKIDDSKDDENNESGWGAGSLPNTIKFENGSVKINNYLGFSGKYMQIDTTIGLGSLDFDGRLYVTPVGSWFKSDTFNIMNGRFTFDLPSADPIFGFVFNKGISAAFNLEAASMMKVSGFSVLPNKFTFIGGLDAVGVALGGKIFIKNMAKNCIKKEDKETKEDFGKIEIQDLRITSQGIALNTTISSMGLIPRFCISSLHIVYDNIKDSLSVDGGFAYNDANNEKPWFSGNFGFATNQYGLNWLKFGFTLDNPIVIPFPSPPIAAFKGMGFDIKDLQRPDWDWKLGGIFTNPSIQVGSAQWGVGTYWEGAFSGRWKWPNIWEIAADSIRFMNLKALGGWQGMARAKLAIDLTQSITISGSYSWCNWEADQWIFLAEGGLRLSWNATDLFVSGKLSGSVTLPAVLKSYFMGELINNYFGLPYKLAQVEAQFLNSRIGFSGTFPALGTRAVIFDLSKSWSDTKFMTFPETLNLYKTLKVNDIPTTILFPDSDGQSGLPAITKEYKNSNRMLGNDTSWVEIPANTNMDRIIVKISGLSQLPLSVLNTPSGEFVTETLPDSSIMYSVGLINKNTAYWTIVEPANGNWKIGIVNPQLTDSVMVYAFNKAREKFVINSSSKDREVSVNWNSTNPPSNSEVLVYLDEDSTGYDGIIVGKVPESSLQYKFRLSDSLRECKYYVYAIRWDNDVSSESYSYVQHSNDKTGLNAPVNIKAVSNAEGETTITWSPSANPKIIGYRIRFESPAGIVTETNTIFSSLYPDSYTLKVENSNVNKVSMLSIDENGYSGCWSEQVNIITGLEIDTYPAENEIANLSIVPNPASGLINITIRLNEDSNINLGIYDLLGNKIVNLEKGFFLVGTKSITYDTGSLPNGYYVLRMQTNAGTLSKVLIVN